MTAMSNRTLSPSLVRPPAEHGGGPESGTTFSRVLRDRTQAIHREAERTGFIADLIRNRATRTGYAAYLASLLPIYEMLEAALAPRHGPLFAPFVDPSLWRATALRRDLDALLAVDRAPVPAPPLEARAYAEAIAATAHDDRLVAHAYARYLGDLSGGQILKPLLARNLGLSPDHLSFYDFALDSGIDGRKAEMRAALDSVEPHGAVADGIVAEALSAFRHTIALSTALAAPA